MKPLLLSLLLAPAAHAQDAPKDTEVAAAVQKGADWLCNRFKGGFGNTKAWNSTLELVMLTLSHAGVKPDDPVFQAGLKAMLECELDSNYRVSLHAMALKRIDPKKHQMRLAHCAQWLVDTQLPTEGWGYPGTLTGLDDTPDPITVEPPKAKAAGGLLGKASTQSRIRIKRQRPADAKLTGDISNAQFALLGLRACAEADIEIPRATWTIAEKFFTRIQRRDGGWGYYFHKMKDKTSYGSMTIAGVCSLAIADHYQKRKPTSDRRILAGINWLVQNEALTENALATKSNVVDPQVWNYYHLYSVERAGRILGLEKFGKTPWYAPGAKILLKEQKSDGSWHTGLKTKWKGAGDLQAADTCFAILFLTRATPPLVASKDTRKK